jgi:hypothetical protein
LVSKSNSAALNAIGIALDRQLPIRVKNGGLVVLSEAAVPATVSTESNHGREEERGSAAGSRQGSTGREGSSGGPWPPGDAASVIGANPQTQYETELSGLAKQYPEAQFWQCAEGFWVLSKCGMLPNLRRHALFLTGIFFPARMTRSWAFWGDPLAMPTWIGPRHTNFPDGSVCAFEPSDGTWKFGDPLVNLLDLCAVWAVRQLHLEIFGRWPGRQAVHFSAERLLELRPDEYCGCEHSERLYGECCMKKDLARDLISDSLNFFWRTEGFREPPAAVVQFMRGKGPIPDLGLVFPIWGQYFKAPPFVRSASAHLSTAYAG